MFKLRFMITLCLAFLTFSMTLRPALGVSDGWPVYGHDASHTSRSSANGPNSADIKWTYVADGGVGETVVANDGTVYARVYISLSQEEIIAINPNGTLKWSIPSSGAQFAFPSIGIDGKVYVIRNPIGATEPDYLLALNPADGTTAWSFDLGRSSIGSGFTTFANNSRPTVDPNGIIYIASTYGHQGYGTIFAINPNGTQKWAWDTSQDSLYCGSSTYQIFCAIESSPVIAPNGYLYFKPYGSGVIALSSATGTFIWRNDFNGAQGGADPFGQSLSVGTNNVAYTSEGTGRFNYYAVNPNNSVKWTFSTDNWNDAALSPISADGSAVFHSDNGGILYSLDTGDGALRWRFDMGIPFTGIDGVPVLAANGIIYFTTGGVTTGTPTGSHGYVYAVRADSGSLIWKYEIGFTGADLSMGPDGTLYVPDDSNKLYAFRCADGTCAIPPHNRIHTVTNLNNGGAGSLRQAVADSFYGDTIQFQTGLTGTIALTSPIIVGVRVTINGPATGTIKLDGGDTNAVLSVAPYRGLNINHLTIANGKPGMIAGGIVHMNSMVFNSNDNPSGNGGAIDVSGANVSIDRSTFSNNTGYYGGGIYNSGITTISSSTFSSNHATTFDGGAIFNLTHMAINGSTFSGNTSSFGGALSNNGTLTVSNSTITGNSGTFGGALMNSGVGSVTIVNSTLAQNNGGGIYDSASSVTLQNTIVSDNSGGNCDRTVTDGGGNLQYPGSNCGTMPIGNPLLAALANNGGPTWTMALTSGSAAIDAGNNTICAGVHVNNLDQRGANRPVDGDGNGSAKCDVGAYEAGATIVVTPTPDPLNAAPPRNYFTVANPRLTWNRVSDATGYEVAISKSSTFATLVYPILTATVNQLSITVAPLPGEGTYYWRVRAIRNGIPGLWSAFDSFVVDLP